MLRGFLLIFQSSFEINSFADIDECLIPGSCGANTDCDNQPGTYTCTCKNGYSGDPYDNCIGKANYSIYYSRFQVTFQSVVSSFVLIQ